MKEPEHDGMMALQQHQHHDDDHSSFLTPHEKKNEGEGAVIQSFSSNHLHRHVIYVIRF